MKPDGKIIFSPQLANYLLQRGFTIIKLKEKRNAPNESVFVFRIEDDILDVIEEWVNYAPQK